jgi:hypothetical protein
MVRAGKLTTAQDVPQVTSDAEVERLMDAGEAGVGDTLRIYEQIERVYMVSTAASLPLQFVSDYSTDTFPG